MNIMCVVKWSTYISLYKEYLWKDKQKNLATNASMERTQGTSLVVQWLGLRLSLPGAWVRSLLRELISQNFSVWKKKKKEPRRSQIWDGGETYIFSL